MRDLNRRQAQWSLYLSQFTFKVTYRKGESMQADALSRFSMDHDSDREDNRQITVILPKHFQTVAAAHYKPASDTLGERIRQASAREAEVIEGLRSIDKITPKALTDGTTLWDEEDGFVYHKGKLYVPNVKELCHEVVETCHDSITTGHPGKNGTIELVSPYYWWPRMAGFITKYVKGCDKRQRYRKDRHSTAPIIPHEVPEGPWQLIGVDLIGPLPMSRGKDMILNIVDHYTKQIHLFPVTSQITAEGVASIYLTMYFPCMGFLRKSSVIEVPSLLQGACVHYTNNLG